MDKFKDYLGSYGPQLYSEEGEKEYVSYGYRLVDRMTDKLFVELRRYADDNDMSLKCDYPDWFIVENKKRGLNE